MKDAIRLTNKTAIALLRSARRMRAVHVALVAALTVALAAAAVYWGLRWLPAVPLTLGAAALLDALLLARARGSYLMAISQAICTEAAAREIRAGAASALRREQAIADLMSAKADLNRVGPQGTDGVTPFFEPAADGAPQDEPDAAPQASQASQAPQAPQAPQTAQAAQDAQAPRGDVPVHRRRRQTAANLQIIRNQQAK